MAPQRSAAGLSTSYGAIDLSDTPKVQERADSGRVKLLVALSMATMVLVSVTLTLTVTPAPLQQASPASAVDELFPGDDLASGKDCQCGTNECVDLAGTVFGECAIDTTANPNGECLGFDYTDAYLKSDGLYYAHCDRITGLYNCWNFPCINGGFCVDGENDYTCVCQFGWEGVNCQTEIDECKYTEDGDDFVEGESPVCHQYATCSNSPGSYACECNPGFFGDGFASDQSAVHWGSILVEDNKYGWLSRSSDFTLADDDSNQDGVIDRFGCTDVNDCSSSPCFNGGQCVDLWDGHARDPDTNAEVFREDMALQQSQAFYCDCTVTLPYTRFAGDYCQEDVNECDSGLHNCDKDDRSECVNNEGSFSCQCRQFWEGDGYSANDAPADWGCEQANGCALYEGYEGCADIDDCTIVTFTGSDLDANGVEDVDVSSPCLNGATCTNDGEGTGEYKCFCVVGWRGHDCEIDINECEEFEEAALGCDVNAYCSNTPGSWQCLCNNGWTGDGQVEAGCYDADDCEFSPCQHGGTCTDCGTLCYICDCIVGWRGKSCEVDWDECMMGIHTCHDMAICINVPGSFECECEPGYSGDGYDMCNEVNDCNRWEDDASQDDDTLTDYAIKKYSADGTLVRQETPVTPAPWSDDRPIMVDGAIVHQCGEWDPARRIFRPHGSCTDVGPAAFLCACDIGWSDANCDLDINECARATDVCHKYATCVNTQGSYGCVCNTGFTGDGISACNDIDDCSFGPEKCDKGFCTDLGIGDFRCTCNEGWSDRLCDTDVDECATMTHTCDGERAICTNTQGSFKCACKPGYTGDGIGRDSCEDADDCGSAPCENGACQDNGENSYSCNCDEGWTNFGCDFDVNECILGTHDCHPDGKCVNTPGRYYCRCVSGYTGDGYTCTDLDDCDPDPCDPVHGTCSDAGQNKYECACDPGYMKPDCVSDEVECQTGTHECDPNADCFNTYGSYICVCQDEFFGDGVTCAPCTQCEEQCPEEFIGDEGRCHTGPGFERDTTFPACDAIDRTCMNVNECGKMKDNCDLNADCTDGYGSFTCACQAAFSYWGTGIEGECFECYECVAGEFMHSDCSSTNDRVCDLAIPDGNYALETEADSSVKQCLVHWKEAGKVFPERYSWGGRADGGGPASEQSAEQAVEPYSELAGADGGPAPDYCENPICGVCDWSGRSAAENLVMGMEAVWTFRRLSGDLYLIFNSADGNGMRCLGFSTPDAPYPTLVTWTETTERADTGLCVDADEAEVLDADGEPTVCEADEGCGAAETCKFERVIMGQWTQNGEGVENVDRCLMNDQGAPKSCELGYFCGFEDSAEGDAKSKMMGNGGTVWNVKPLGCQGDFCEEKIWQNKWVIRSLARGDKNRDGAIDEMDYDCLFFPTEGSQYTHPRRVPDAPSDDGVWLGTSPSSDVDANGDLECGIFADGGSQEQALVDNLQAVWSLIPLPGGEPMAPPPQTQSPLEQVVGLEKYEEWMRMTVVPE